jgi:hypothetical protein
MRDECTQRFAAFKYESRREKVYELLKIAYDHIILLERAKNWNTSAVRDVMNLVYRTMYVKQRPLWKFTKSYGWEGEAVIRDIAFKINNLQSPPAGNLAQFYDAVGRTTSVQRHHTPQESLFFRYLAMIQKSGITESKRKLTRVPQVEGTFLGKPLPECRQRTSVRRFYRDFLRNMNPPVSPHIWTRLDALLSMSEIHGVPNDKLRFVKRRIQSFLRDTYVVNEDPTTAVLTRTRYHPGISQGNLYG